MVDANKCQWSFHFWTQSTVILFLIAIQGLLLRLMPVVKHEVVLHEYDPYFNYKCAEFMQRNGIIAFFRSFDEGSWYPFGRKVGETVYPGLMIVAYSTHRLLQYIGIELSLKEVCVFLPPLLSIVMVYGVYMLSNEITKDEVASLISAFVVETMPSLLTRTTAGAFDNESLAIPLLVWSFYAWLVAVRNASLLSSALAAIVTFLMALSWGGYIFLLNAIACFTLAGIVLAVDAKRLSLVYIAYHPLTVAMCSFVPIIGKSVVTTVEMKLPHIVFAISLIYTITISLSEHPHVSVPLLSALVSIVWISFITMPMKGTSTLSARLWSLISPGTASARNPLVASISEHHPTRWTNMVLDVWVPLLYIPTGLYACFKDGLRIGYLVLAIYGTLSAYFAAMMVRLVLVFAPAAAILSGAGLACTLQGARGKRKSMFVRVFTYAMAATFMLANVFHATWISCTIYSNPNVLSSWRTSSGERVVVDDFRDAYSWIRHNLRHESVVMAWWDYGYQLKQMANCTVMTDNNTSNYEQIALTAMILASREEEAHRMLTRLKVDYVMVVYGGVSMMSMDDISKFPWMVRIAAKQFPQVQKSRLLHHNGKSYAKQTLLHRLCYNGVHAVSAMDNVRNTNVESFTMQPKYFTEAFTSENWLVRIYRVNALNPTT